MATLTPFLWFDHRLDEAVTFYTGVFDDGRVLHSARYGAGGPQPAGAMISMTFELAGQRLRALNGGPTRRPKARPPASEGRAMPRDATITVEQPTDTRSCSRAASRRRRRWCSRRSPRRRCCAAA